MSSAGGRPSRQKMVSVGTSIVPPGPRPSPADTPGPSTTATTPQVTASLHDFAASLANDLQLWKLLKGREVESGLGQEALQDARPLLHPPEPGPHQRGQLADESFYDARHDK